MSFALGRPAVLSYPAAPDHLIGLISDRCTVIFPATPGGWAARRPFGKSTYGLPAAPEGAAAIAGCPVAPCWYCGADVAGATDDVPAWCCKGHEDQWRMWRAAPTDAFGVKVESLRTCHLLMTPYRPGDVPDGVSLRTQSWARSKATLEERQRIGRKPRSLDLSRGAK